MGQTGEFKNQADRRRRKIETGFINQTEPIIKVLYSIISTYKQCKENVIMRYSSQGLAYVCNLFELQMKKKF